MKPGSKAWKVFMAKLYGFGAAVVIVGAMFKIMHWPGAGAMLVIGLSTEAVIFIFSAFEPIHEDPKWELVYPELALGHMDDHDGHGAIEHHGKKGSVTEELDKMLEEAKIEPELIQSLGNGLRSLTDATHKIGDVSNASVATNEYIDSLRGASKKVEQLSDSYVKASESIMGLTNTQSEGASFGEQMQKLSTNLSALNNIYEMQLKGSSSHLEATSKLYGGINELMQNLHDSLEDTKKYKENMSDLARNLTALNTIYGNMLAAMNINTGSRG
ncbi:MAG TPA: gliding motility protein GldL [Flavobacteriales bacterium]|nr:gliding motility protein GldL [Flavobacteriales bacterium]HCA83770.1 gliding motility protein GldL [Flavobacteriales bacterium]HRE73287.1 gliding motility protein GldL [Flavobacteriales bacterium]HRE96258.1 gliding motility protein GldL [Flavobacteriales bacterium]HRJ35023.1 gliding motility protein GldL [Flavobacteriales bacterium]